MAHCEDGPVGAISVTVDPNDGTDAVVRDLNPRLCTAPATPERIDLGGLTADQVPAATVTYTVSSPTAGPTTARLDGMEVEAFSGPLLRARVSFDANRLTVESWSVLR